MTSEQEWELELARIRSWEQAARRARVQRWVEVGEWVAFGLLGVVVIYIWRMAI
jgi:hypothetical protein